MRDVYYLGSSLSHWVTVEMKHNGRFLALGPGESLMTFILGEEEAFQVAAGQNMGTGTGEQSLSGVSN